MTSRQRRTAPLGALLLSAVCVVPLTLQDASEDEGPSIAGTHDVIEQWVETRRVISREKRDWKLGREVLDERIYLVRQEIESLRGRITEAEENIAKADEKRAELVEENELLKEASSTLAGTVATLEARVKALLTRLPEPIVERVKPLSQRFPDDPDDTKLSLGERFQNVIGVLNEVNKFNGEITVTSEVRTLASGSSAEVTALYLGIGQGYYVSAQGDAAGVGTATAEGWEWTPANDAAAAIAQAIAVLNNEEEATFVPLPIDVQ